MQRRQFVAKRLECSPGSGKSPKGRSLAKVFFHIRGVVTFAGCTVNTVVWFVPLMTFSVFKLLVPIKSFRVLMTRWITAMGENWVSVNSVILGLRHNTHLDVRGLENLSPDRWYLVVANHQAWVDIVVLQAVFSRQIPFLKFFIKQQLIWFPLLGLAWWAMDMPFMKRYSKSYLARHPEKKGRDLDATRKACEKFRETPTSIINFVEGTRFSAAKHSARRSPYNNLLPPRAGGIALALSSMGNMFDSVVDVTIVYPDGVQKFWDMCCGSLKHVVVDIRQRPVEEWLTRGDYSNDREFRARFHSWLADIWAQKDSKISTIHEREHHADS